MAARAIWKGVLRVGSAGIPVKLYSAIEDRAVHFHLLEQRTQDRVKQHMVDPDTREEVAKEEIRKGFEVDQDTFVILNDDEFSKVQPKPSRDIEIRHFVPSERIVHQWYERPYYLGPDEDETKDYFALAAALEGQNREGIAHWVMRNKRYIGALRGHDGYLLLIKLRYADEVLSARDLPAPGGRAPDAREIAMAEQLIAALEDDFRPEDYRDEYRDRVLQYIESKAKGKKPKLAAMPAPKKAASLVDVLAASLETAKHGKGKRVA
jgi:DNA end-binding protein Ku